MSSIANGMAADASLPDEAPAGRGAEREADRCLQRAVQKARVQDVASLRRAGALDQCELREHERQGAVRADLQATDAAMGRAVVHPAHLERGVALARVDVAITTLTQRAQIHAAARPLARELDPAPRVRDAAIVFRAVVDVRLRVHLEADLARLERIEPDVDGGRHLDAQRAQPDDVFQRESAAVGVVPVAFQRQADGLLCHFKIRDAGQHARSGARDDRQGRILLR